MKYMGSKNRISKYILPIIDEYIDSTTQYYIEPFCGGCNMIDKVITNSKYKDNLKYIAADNNRYLIAMFNAFNNGFVPPIEITREHYSDVRNDYNANSGKYDDYYIGYIGFTGSYNGRFFDGGYSGKVLTKNGTYRDYINEAKNNLLDQVPILKNVRFIYSDYQDLIIPSNSIVYCDPPYKGVKKYSYSIDHDEFWEWCRELVKRGIKVLVSEYNAPDDFIPIWHQELKTCINQTKTINATEKLFVHKSQLK